MKKTSVYLDAEQKDGLERVVGLTGRSQSALIRDGINRVIRDHLAKRPGTRPSMKARFHNAAIVGQAEDLTEGFAAEAGR